VTPPGGFWVLIPARLHSTRLPGKVLLDLAGRPMVQHVYERAVASGAAAVVIATDDEGVAERCRGFGASVQLTGCHHRSGTDRLAEAVATLGLPEGLVVVNVQADEPLLPPTLVRQVADDLAARPEAHIATLCAPIRDDASLFDPNVVKVVRDQRGYALYFSRAPIPWHRDGFRDAPGRLPRDAGYFRHIGLYAYRVKSLLELAGTPPDPLELAESLEQLRALARGMRIYVGEASGPAGPGGVDTREDLERVRAILSAAERP
jgi:3-deoxy-manno-octulosonate cytidylyltransferase (CMP-KDO synthetase)